MSSKPIDYLVRPTTILRAGAGLIIYLPYQIAHQDHFNPILLLVAVLVAVLSPAYSKLSNRVEGSIQFKLPFVTAGRVGRFLGQFFVNLVTCWLLIIGGGLSETLLAPLGGLIGASVMTNIVSQGFQYLAMTLANRGWGNKNQNVTVALFLNFIIISLLTVAPSARIIIIALAIIGLLAGAFIFGVGVLSDLRSRFYPKRGIGIFIGTFNPIHKTHIELIERAINERNLEKVFIHPTVIPKLHAEALRKGEIAIASYKHGMRVYEKTDRADSNVSYFPTGNQFYEFETRLLLIQLAVKETGLEDKVEVLPMAAIYEENGFYGIIREIKKSYKGVPIHGIHGSDLGGMWNRAIYDESGWIYPFAVKRIDGVSATAIRNGAQGMITPTVQKVVDNLRNEKSYFEIDGVEFYVSDGIVCYYSPHLQGQ